MAPGGSVDRNGALPGDGSEAVVGNTIEVVDGRIRTAVDRPRVRRWRPGTEEVRQSENNIGDVHRGVVIGVTGVQAVRGGPPT